MSRFQSMNEEVRVFADFNGPRIRPVAFLLHGRRITIQRINLVSEAGSGPTKRMHFSVSDEGNTFTLTYNPFRMRWTLTEMYIDG